MIIRILHIVFLLVMLLPCQGRAQQFTMDIDTHAIRLGEQTNLRLSLELPTEAKNIRWPSFHDSLSGAVELVSMASIDTIHEGDKGSFSLVTNIVITSFDSGYHVITPFTVQYMLEGDSKIYAVSTQAKMLEVHSVDVDTEGDIKDIREVYSVPITFREILGWILPVLLMLIIVATIYYLIMKSRNREPIKFIPRKPVIPPHRIALDALEDLKNKKLWQQEKLKEYYSELTGILRAYTEGRFKVQSLEMTTDETLDALREVWNVKQDIKLMGEILQSADMVKFAKSRPLPDEHETAYNNGLAFVKNTMANVEDDLRKPMAANSNTKPGPDAVGIDTDLERK